MCANEPRFSRISVAVLSIVAGIAVSVQSSVAFGQSDNAAKLKELERAMTQPQNSVEGSPTAKKTRTRAIVFDNNESEAPAAGASAQTGASQKQSSSSGVADCRSISANSDGVSVDFPIQFNANSATITPASRGTLKQIARILSLSPDKCVLVEGHTDVSGDPQRNQELSQERAESVVNYISSSNSVDRKRLVPVGKGFSETLKNLDPRDPKNRRVVFKVI